MLCWVPRLLYHPPMIRTHILWLCLCLPGLGLAAESSPAAELPSLVGSWEGTLVIGPDSSNLAFTFSESNGEYQAAMVSTAMGIYGMPAESIEFNGMRVIIRLPRIDGVFTGRLRLDESGENIERIDGDWFQYAEMLPITLQPVEEPTF